MKPSDDKVAAKAVIVAAFALLATLLCSPQDASHPSIAQSSGARAPGIAESYIELRDVRRGVNGEMYLTTSSDLTDHYDEVAAADSEAATRARERRAYRGAPPTVPHAVTQRTLDCVGCHVDGAVVGGKVAPRVTHEVRPSCTQCHVPMSGARHDGPAPLMIENDFDGLAP